MPSINTPKLSFPFRLDSSATRAAVVEQGSDDEIVDCVEVILRTPVGTRIEVPTYGIPDYTFREDGVDVRELFAIVSGWEPRAKLALDSSTFDELVNTVGIAVEGKTNG